MYIFQYKDSLKFKYNYQLENDTLLWEIFSKLAIFQHHQGFDKINMLELVSRKEKRHNYNF